MDDQSLLCWGEAFPKFCQAFRISKKVMKEVQLNLMTRKEEVVD